MLDQLHSEALLLTNNLFQLSVSVCQMNIANIKIIEKNEIHNRGNVGNFIKTERKAFT